MSKPLTARDLELLSIAFKCFKSEPQLDFAKFAQLANFKNAATASACWRPVKQKILADTGANGTPTGTPSKRAKASASTPKGSQGSQSKAAALEDDEEDDVATPSKSKGAGTKRKAGGADNAAKKENGVKKAKFEDIYEDEDDENEDMDGKSKRVKRESVDDNDYGLATYGSVYGSGEAV